MIVDTPTQTVLYTLEQAIKAYRKLCQQNIDKVMDKLTVDQALILIVLDKHPALNQQQIADLVFKDKASLTRIIELLVQKDLLTREIHATDRRKFELHLTVQGRHTLAQLTDTILLNQRTALAGLSEAELAQFHTTLQKIIANCTTPALCA
ncbi:MarR family winged helix-turn-helix transcriptional regulator [Hymenobacter sp. HDW8]|uniref:MarR family winged helix-turn-helix transcriptional regulator n=1 Tax=Hymenobacter sp. HDW8 TaxID=2714932 RepID=UPI00140B37B5|nr:MarR family transcriptional regulator [Hymenobacter sp. HDW8]QIL75106.1 MarR family transcriptional regulator [Hymenobacter sp. HDW8]